MQPAHWLVLLRAARSHLPFPIEHQKQPGLHFEPSASPSRWVSGAHQQERNNSKGKYQGCICVLGTPCKYSTHRATLMVMGMVMVMGMAAPRPLCVTSPPTAATIRRTMQVHGRNGTKGRRGTTLHTRHARSLCTAAASVYICFACRRFVDVWFFFSSRFPLHQQSASTRQKQL